MTTGFIVLTLIYVISMEFLSLSRRRSSSRNVLSDEERGETAVFAGFNAKHEQIPNQKTSVINNLNIKIKKAANILSILKLLRREFTRIYT